MDQDPQVEDGGFVCFLAYSFSFKQFHPGGGHRSGRDQKVEEEGGPPFCCDSITHLPGSAYRRQGLSWSELGSAAPLEADSITHTPLNLAFFILSKQKRLILLQDVCLCALWTLHLFIFIIIKHTQ